jgi:hypothetical protein
MKPPQPASTLRRLVIAPPASHPGLHSAVLTVECAHDEDVEWTWTETPTGRFVSGYRIVPRLTSTWAQLK